MLPDGYLVALHFQGTLEDGSVFDSSWGRSPRYFVLGRQQMIPAFEAQVREMSVGENRTFTLTPAEAYGDHDPALVWEVPAAEAPQGAKPGNEVQLTGGRPGIIRSVGPETVVVDGNHPLAGKTLRFEVELVSAALAAS